MDSLLSSADSVGRANRWAFQLRSWVRQVATALHPYARKIFPNFIAVHYALIIFSSFTCSVIVYGIRNIRYIDALFIGVATSTQAGMNTLDFNTLRLYQQIFCYITVVLTTPMYIGFLLLLLRLFWFKSHFDDIELSSKLNHRMRRLATLAAIRTASIGNTRRNTATNRELGTPGYPADDPSASGLLPPSTARDPPEEGLSPSPQVSAANPDARDGIRFGSLPSPRNERTRQQPEPSDMYRSIAMLQGKQGSGTLSNPSRIFGSRSNQPSSLATSTASFPKQLYSEDLLEDALDPDHDPDHDRDRNNHEDEDDEDILVIKPPNEIEKDASGPIYTRRNKATSVEPPTWASKLKLTFSHSAAPAQGLSRRPSAVSLIRDDDSIDSEHSHGHTTHPEVDGDSEKDEALVSSDSDLHRHASLLYEDPLSTRRPEGNSNMFEDLLQKPNRAALHKRRQQGSGAIHRILSRSFSRSRPTTDDEEENDLEAYYSYPNRKDLHRSYLSWTPTVGRNSTFAHLSEAQREELGGVEYRAVKLLIKIIVAYYVGCHLVCAILYLAWILHRPEYRAIARQDGFNQVWWAIWTGMSTFNNLGLAANPTSLIPFVDTYFVPLVAGFFIIIGNVGFPCALRFIIWVLYKTSKPLSLYRESLSFLLDHPRRCFTMLFPSVPTWCLFGVLIALNVVDVILFLALDLRNSALQDIAINHRVLAGLFQAVSTRTSGYNIFDLSILHPGMQLSFIIMMYISALPVAISIRRTNVYEEQSLGIYSQDDDSVDENTATAKSYIGSHLKNQVSFDIWYLVLGYFIVVVSEGSRINKGDPRFSGFAVLFEVVSAYACVGLSLGYTTINGALAGEFNVVSKLTLIALMIRGRHRGLPYEIDRAIMLPSEKMMARDAQLDSRGISRQATTEGPDTLSRAILRTILRQNPGVAGFGNTLRRALSSPFTMSQGTHIQAHRSGSSDAASHA